MTKFNIVGKKTNASNTKKLILGASEMLRVRERSRKKNFEENVRKRNLWI